MQGVHWARPNCNPSLRSIAHSLCSPFFRYFEAQLASKGAGTTFKAITQDVVKNLEIPIPPLPEQERIVARIEELFSQLDAGVETLKKQKHSLWCIGRPC